MNEEEHRAKKTLIMKYEQIREWKMWNRMNEWIELRSLCKIRLYITKKKNQRKNKNRKKEVIRERKRRQNVSFGGRGWCVVWCASFKFINKDYLS